MTGTTLPPEAQAQLAEEKLDQLRRLAASITAHVEGLKAEYAARLRLYADLGDLGVKQELIGEAAGVGASAVGVALFAERERQRLAALSPEERAVEREKAEAAKRKRRRGRPAA